MAPACNRAGLPCCQLQYLSYDLGGRRRLLSFGRNLLQMEKSGVQLKIAIETSTLR